MTAVNVGLIGLGLVGGALAPRLISAGYHVLGRDRIDAAADAAQRIGVELADDSRSIALRSRIIFLSLPDSAAVDAVLWDDRGVVAGCGPDSIVVDTTTSSPTETVRHARRLAERGIKFVDAPIVGSSKEISEAKAVAIVGDREEGATDYIHFLSTFTKRLFFLGEPGRGHTAKLVVNLVLGLNRIVLSEALGLARRNDLDLSQTLEILKSGAAYSEVMDTQGEVMLQGNFGSPVARLAQHAKDVRLILALAAASDARVPMSELHDSLLTEAIAANWGQLDNSAVINLFVPPGR